MTSGTTNRVQRAVALAFVAPYVASEKKIPSEAVNFMVLSSVFYICKKLVSSKR